MKHLIRAISLLGSQKKLATACGVTQPAVHNWLNGSRIMKAEKAIKIEAVTNGEVRREQLRPDIDWTSAA